MRDNCCVVIPAYRPGEKMIGYVAELISAEIGPVVVVDDGSESTYEAVFECVAEMKNCIVLHHKENKGKGAAIKTAIDWYLKNDGKCCGVITADCDGQHSAADVRKLASVMQEKPEGLILGCRDFGEGTPRRSALGNRLISLGMKLLYGVELTDTQTGLRGVPASLLEAMAVLSGEHYEYELNMLIYARKAGVPFVVVPIQTIYFDDNAGSHYRPVRDSLRIFARLCSGLVQYGLSSAVSALVDVDLYAVLIKWVLSAMPFAERLLFAAVGARILSSVVNYSCNRQLPYVQNTKVFPTVIRYYILWACQLSASIVLVWTLCTGFYMDELPAKLIVDLFLAVMSYQVQLHWVFRGESETEKKQKNILLIYNFFARAVRKAVAAAMAGNWSVKDCRLETFFSKRAEGQLDEKPAVYVVHHQNLFGPVCATILLPGEVHLWALHVFCDRRACFDQYYRYTFTQRFGWPAPVAFAAAGVLSLIVPPLLHAFGAIPVHRGKLEIHRTMEQSIDALTQGESLLICPDRDYASPDQEMGEIYTGFLHLESEYRQKTGEHLAFIPVSCSKANKELVVGEPIYFNGSQIFAKEQKAVAQLLVEKINSGADVVSFCVMHALGGKK